MERRKPVSLNPDLVIGVEAAIDRMGSIASRAVELAKPNFAQQIKLVRQEARILCPSYSNCRAEDWCWHCSSGTNGGLFLGDTCLDCKLLTAEAFKAHRPALVSIQIGADLSDIT